MMPTGDDRPRYQEPGWYKSLWANWPYELAIDQIKKYPNEGVLPVATTLRSDVDFAFALPLSSKYLNRPRSSVLSDQEIDEAFQRLNLVRIGVYTSKDNETFHFYPKAIVRLSPILTLPLIAKDNKDQVESYVSESNRSSFPTSIQYLLMRFILGSRHNFYGLHLVALLKSDPIQRKQLTPAEKKIRKKWKTRDWVKYWENLKLLGNDAPSFFRSDIIDLTNECGSQGDHFKVLPRSERKQRTRLVMLAITGKVFRKNWKGEKEFVAKWKWISGSPNVDKPVFRLYYGFDKTAPLMLAPKFHMEQLYNANGELCITVISEVPMRHHQRDRKLLEEKLERKWDILAAGKNAFFVALILGNQSENGTYIEMVGRSQLVGFTTDALSYRLQTVWFPTIVIVVIIGILLFIIPSSRTWILNTGFGVKKYLDGNLIKYQKFPSINKKNKRSSTTIERKTRRQQRYRSAEKCIPHQLSYVTDDAYSLRRSQKHSVSDGNSPNICFKEIVPKILASNDISVETGLNTFSPQTSLTSSSTALSPSVFRARIMPVVKEEEDTVAGSTHR